MPIALINLVGKKTKEKNKNKIKQRTHLISDMQNLIYRGWTEGISHKINQTGYYVVILLFLQN